MDDVMKDNRFKHIARDPRFRRMKRKDRKVQIDKRFQGMFKDKQFKLKYSVDKRGRPVQSTTSENLERFYDLQSSSDEDEDEDEDEKAKNKEKEEDSSSDEDQSSASEDEGLKTAQKKKVETSKDEDAENGKLENDEEDEDEESDDSGPDLARGQGNVETSSSEEEDEEEDEDDVDHRWAELDQDAVEAPEVTRRLALCNMDWDRIKASDIMVLVNSFKPSRGAIESVQIYPSEYGLQRMKEEDKRGPTEVVNAKDEDGVASRERLRQYQLNRLRYYYAVITCDSVETANHIYEECDGMEYESSSNKIDLRYIPDDMTFDQEPKSEATQMPDATSYKPTLFTNAALNQSKVELTWDETDKDRTAVTMRKFDKDELEEMDVKQYLASSSSEGEDDPYAGFEDPDFDTEPTVSDTVNKLKEVVTKTEEQGKKEEDGELEIQWDAGLGNSSASGKRKDLTPWEEYLQKKKEKRKKKKEQKTKEKEETSEDSDDDLPAGVDLNDPYFAEELKDSQPGKLSKKNKKKGGKKKEKEADPEEEAQLRMLMMDEEDGRQHFSLEAIQQAEGDKKKKRKKKKKGQQEEQASMSQDDFQLNLGDNRFKEIYENPLYNIDPSAPEYKKTKAMDALVMEKFKRREKGSKKKKGSHDSAVPAKKAKTDAGRGSLEGLQDASLASLVKSVKAKTKTLQEKKKKKHKL